MKQLLDLENNLLGQSFDELDASSLVEEQKHIAQMYALHSDCLPMAQYKR